MPKARGRLAPGFSRWPHADVVRDGLFRYRWFLRDGLTGPTIVQGRACTRWGADRKSVRAYRAAIGLKPRAAGRPVPVDAPVADPEGWYS